jgi:hypothetical protein
MIPRACGASALPLAAALLWGCPAQEHQQQQQDRPGAVRGPEASPDNARPTRRVRPTIDERWAALADEVPGFAGVFVRADTLVVMLVNPARLPEAVHALRRSSDRFPEGSRHVVARRARYNFRQLYDWKRQAVDLMGNRGVVMLGVDEARNRVHLGVLDSSYVEPVRAALIARGVPAGALIVEVTGPFHHLSG